MKMMWDKKRQKKLKLNQENEKGKKNGFTANTLEK